MGLHITRACGTTQREHVCAVHVVSELDVSLTRHSLSAASQTDNERCVQCDAASLRSGPTRRRSSPGGAGRVLRTLRLVRALPGAVGDTMLNYVGSMKRCDGGSYNDNDYGSVEHDCGSVEHDCGSVEHDYGSVGWMPELNLSGYEFEVVPETDIGNFDAYRNVELLLDYLSRCDSRLQVIQENSVDSDFSESSEDQMCLRCGNFDRCDCRASSKFKDRNPYEIEYTNRFLAADLIRRVQFSEESSKERNLALYSEAWTYHGWKLLSRGRRNPVEGLIWTQLQPLWWR